MQRERARNGRYEFGGSHLPRGGITPKYAKRPYTSVALPMVLYAVDVWSPSGIKHQGPRTIASAKATKQVTSVQRAGALAITGGLLVVPTSPTHALNACVHLLQAPLLIYKWCHRTFTRMVMPPVEHSLHKPANWKDYARD